VSVRLRIPVLPFNLKLFWLDTLQKETSMNTLFAFGEGILSPTHLLILLGIGILLFGKRLPEFGRSLGKGIVEFKKGLKGLEDEVEGGTAVRQEPAPLEPPRPPQRVVMNVPKFEDKPNNVQNITPPSA
jgi:sec-independent protein translocase protein TatA